VHLQEDLLHDVFEIRLPTQHAVRETRDVLAMRPKQFAERLGIAALAAFDEARRFHAIEFNSGSRRWLALGDISPPHGNACQTGRQGWKYGQSRQQPCLWCATPAAFSDFALKSAVAYQKSDLRSVAVFFFCSST
jgi:hypothetical protein